MDEIKKGIDLSIHAEDVRRLYYAFHSKSAIASGIDPEDQLQTIYVQILKANRGSAPYDPTKGALYTYLRQIFTWAGQEDHERVTRRSLHTVPDHYVDSGGDTVIQDGVSYDSDHQGGSELQERIESRLVRANAKNLLTVYYRMLAGDTNNEIVAKLGLTRSRVSQLVMRIKKLTQEVINARDRD